jgi:hypothetical protein
LLYPPRRHPIFEAAGRRGALASSEAMHTQHDRDQGAHVGLIVTNQNADIGKSGTNDTTCIGTADLISREINSEIKCGNLPAGLGPPHKM